MARRGRLIRSEEVPPPEFFINIASKAFSDPVSGLESIFAEGSVNVDFKEDTEVADSGAFGSAETVPSAAVKHGGSGSKVTGCRKREQAKACSTQSHHGCFLQEWQAKALCVTWSVRVANAGLKVVALSCSCDDVVSVAGKELTDGPFFESKQRIDGAEGRSEKREGDMGKRLRVKKCFETMGSPERDNHSKSQVMVP